MRDGVIPGAVNLEALDETCTIDCSNSERAARCDVVLSNSSGFGGINAALVLRRDDS
jgi:3-oxoacyl-[acyl-carrier-protein] synthase II